MTQLNLLAPRNSFQPTIKAEDFHDGYAVKRAYKKLYNNALEGAFSMVIPWGENTVAKICNSKETTLAYLQLCLKFKEKNWYMPSWMLRVETLHIYDKWYWAVLEKLETSRVIKDHHDDWWSNNNTGKYPSGYYPNYYQQRDNAVDEYKEVLKSFYPEFKTSGFVDDIHDGNFMCRRKENDTYEVVFTDPGCSDYPVFKCVEDERDWYNYGYESPSFDYSKESQAELF